MHVVKAFEEYYVSFPSCWVECLDLFDEVERSLLRGDPTLDFGVVCGLVVEVIQEAQSESSYFIKLLSLVESRKLLLGSNSRDDQ